MAQRTVSVLIDDITGKELANGEGETVSFALDGNQYEIDIDHKTADKLRAALVAYINAGRRVGGTRQSLEPRGRRGVTRRDPLQTKAIRDWATSNGYDVSGRGRIPASIVEEYEAAH